MRLWLKNDEETAGSKSKLEFCYGDKLPLSNLWICTKTNNLERVITWVRCSCPNVHKWTTQCYCIIVIVVIPKPPKALKRRKNHLPKNYYPARTRRRAGPKGLRAESARAVTGRRCPHSVRGEDFLMGQLNFFTETAVTPERKVEKSFPRWEINRHAEG